jgi:hypothetical protein
VTRFAVKTGTSPAFSYCLKRALKRAIAKATPRSPGSPTPDERFATDALVPARLPLTIAMRE